MKNLGVLYFIAVVVQSVCADVLSYPYRQYDDKDDVANIKSYNRIRRQSSEGINLDVINLKEKGNRVNADITRNIWEDKDQRVDLTGRYSQTFNGPTGAGRPNIGVGATYTHDSFGNIGVNADHTPGIGTSVTARGSVTIWKSDDDSSNLRGEGYYSRGFGGYRSGPEYGGFVIFKRQF